MKALRIIFCLLSFSAIQAATQQKPNIILLFADDAGYDDCKKGSTGAPKAE